MAAFPSQSYSCKPAPFVKNCDANEQQGSLAGLPHFSRAVVEMQTRQIERARQALLRAPASEPALQEVVHELWSLARAVRKDGKFSTELHKADSGLRASIRAVCDTIKDVQPAFSNALTGRFAEALAIIGYRDLGLFELLSERAQEARRELSGKQLGRFLWAMVQLNITEIPRLTDALIKAARSSARIDSLDPETRARIGLSLAFLKEGSARAVLGSHFLDGHHCSLKRWGEMYRALILDKQIVPFEDFDKHRESKREALWALTAREHMSSSFERQVEHWLENALKNRGETFSLRRQENVAGLFVDLTLRLPDYNRTIALEVDGMQFHFTWGPDGGVRRGNDILKRRVLEAHEFEVSNITSNDWRTGLGPRLLASLIEKKSGATPA